MENRMKKTFAKILAVANLALMQVSTAQAGDLMVTDAIARESHIKAARTGAIYFNLMNHGAKPDRLIGLSAEIAEAAELHQTSNADGIMRMRPVEGVDLPAGATVKLSPAETHVMLFGLKAPLVKDQSFKLTLDFETAPDETITVLVGKTTHMDHTHDE
jgi:periplasmic copper chaperone A